MFGGSYLSQHGHVDGERLSGGFVLPEHTDDGRYTVFSGSHLPCQQFDKYAELSARIVLSQHGHAVWVVVLDRSHLSSHQSSRGVGLSDWLLLSEPEHDNRHGLSHRQLLSNCQHVFANALYLWQCVWHDGFVGASAVPAGKLLPEFDFIDRMPVWLFLSGAEFFMQTFILSFLAGHLIVFAFS